MTKDEERKMDELYASTFPRGLGEAIVTDPTAVLDKLVELGVLVKPFHESDDLYEVVPKPPSCAHERERVLRVAWDCLVIRCEDCGYERSVPNAWPKPKEA